MTPWKDMRLIDIAVDMIVYVGATHGDHAGKLSTLLTTKNYDVYGSGLNTLVTNSTFSRDYPMDESNVVSFSHWVKVEKLSQHFIRKITIGFGWGAAVTKNHDLLLWGTGATTFVKDPGVEIVELFDPDALCRSCMSNCANYGRRVGNTWFSYCKEKQSLVTYSATSRPPPPGCHVRRLGNRQFGALTCSVCSTECDIEVMESHSFNYCNNCNHLWDLDENAMPMDVPSKPVQSFVRRLDHQGMIRDVTPGLWGFWVLDSNRVVFSGHFVHQNEYYRQPIWWRQQLTLSSMKTSQRIVSIHSNMTDVFVVTDTGMLYRRVESHGSKSSVIYNIPHVFRKDGALPSSCLQTSHKLSWIPLETGVKKICCGRLASLCLLEDGRIWVIYSHTDGEETGAEEVMVKGDKGCTDISGISNADLFYVNSDRYRPSVKKKHPDKKGCIIEIIFGEMSCKTFLCTFAKGCRVFGEGNIAYDEEVMKKLQPQQQQEPSFSSEDPSQITEQIPSATSALQGPEISVGLGFPVGAPLWSSWGSRLIRNAAVGWRCVAGASQKAYQAVLSGIGAKTKGADTGLNNSMGYPPLDTLPPFQSGLYGKPLFSDLIIRLSTGNFHAHRIILCSTSKYFREKLSGTNADVKMLDMRNQNPRAYRCLLKHFYQLKPDNLAIHDMLDLLELATTYDERRIAADVEERIKSMINVNNVTIILEVAQRFDFNSLRQACELFMKNDPDIVAKNESTAASTSNAPTISPKNHLNISISLSSISSSKDAD